MGQIGANDLKAGLKVEIDGEPYNIISVELVKPGKGQAFTRTRVKHLLSGKLLERTFKSNESLPEADVEETKMRLLYRESDGFVFMDDKSFEQLSIPLSIIGDKEVYMMEEILYDLIIYKGAVADVIPPTFLNMKIKETSPGVKGDTASGRVLKPAITETGAKIQIPIFVEEGELVKVDTRTGEYVSRV